MVCINEVLYKLNFMNYLFFVECNQHLFLYIQMYMISISKGPKLNKNQSICIYVRIYQRVKLLNVLKVK